ncbi:MAG: hypothetical protein FWD63_08480 [Propionibacteriaceae bacterium]|nr:hypothetical protein [Propionibacteriaceae bacterium]
MSITRTTISIDSGLLVTAKQVADERRQTLGQLLTRALQQYIVETTTADAAVTSLPVMIRTSGRGGVRPGININSNAELFEMMDEEDMARWSSQM